MAFRRTLLSHQRRHEELAENNMQCGYTIAAVAASDGGDRTASVAESARAGVSSSNSVCTAATLSRTDVTRRKMHAPRIQSIGTIIVWEKNTRRVIPIQYNVYTMARTE